MAEDWDNTAIDESITIRAPARLVWRALVDPGVRFRWWGYLDLDPVVGGRVTEVWEGPDGTMHTNGVITAMEEERMLRMDWADEGWDSTADVLFELRPFDGAGGTVVRLRETGLGRLPGGAAIAEEHRAGWRMHLANLRRCVEAADR